MCSKYLIRPSDHHVFYRYDGTNLYTAYPYSPPFYRQDNFEKLVELGFIPADTMEDIENWVKDNPLDITIESPGLSCIKKYLQENLNIRVVNIGDFFHDGPYQKIQLLLDKEVISESWIKS